MDSIIVRSNDPIVEQPAPVGEENKSVPAEKQPEQNEESTESETVENEVEDDSEEHDESEDESSDSEEKPKGKKKGGFQRRIGKLNAKISEREKELEYWKSQALKGSEEKSEPKKIDVDNSNKPNPDDFDSHADYVEALTDWKVNQFDKQKQQKEERSRFESEQQKAIQAHVERVKSYAEKVADFEDVISEVDDIPVSAAVQELIISSENGAALMYELAKNRDFYSSLCKMSPIQAARELGKFEAKMSSSNSEEKLTKKITSAPKPLSSVGSGKGVVNKSPDEMNQKEYEKWRAEQIKKRA